MKRVLSLLLAMVMVFSMLPVSAFADETLPTILFETEGLAELQEAKSEDPELKVKGETFTVSAYLQNNPGFASFKNTLMYNDKVIKPIGFVTEYDEEGEEILTTGVFKNNWSVVWNHENAQITASRSNGKDYTGTATHLYTIEFEFIAENGELGLGLQTEITDPKYPPFTFNDVNKTLTAADYVIDDSAIVGQSIGIIPYGAPFTTVSTNAGPVIAVEQQENVTANYSSVPYYIVTIPAGATEVYLTAPGQEIMYDFQLGGYYATAYAFDVQANWNTMYISYGYKEGKDGTPQVIIPVNMVGVDMNIGETELCFVEDEDGKLTHAFGIEDANYACLGAISFRYAQSEETLYDITVAEDTAAHCEIGVLNDQSEEITQAAEGDTVTLAISNVEAGYKVSGINATCDGDEVELNGEYPMFSFEMPAGEVEISVSFEKITYTIGGTGSVENGTITAQVAGAEAATATVGDEVTLVFTPADGYQLVEGSVAVAKDGVTGEDAVVAVTDNKFTMPANAVTVSAVFEAETPAAYAVTVVQGQGGTVTADKETAAQGETVTLTVIPASGYELEKFTAEPEVTIQPVEGTNQYTFAMPGEAVQVTPSFKKSVYSVAVTAADHGTVTADKTQASSGDTVVLTVEADQGYQLKSLSVLVGTDSLTYTQVEGETNQYTFTMLAGNVTVNAEFEEVPADEPVIPEGPITAIVDGAAVPVQQLTDEIYHMTAEQGKAVTLSAENINGVSNDFVGSNYEAYNGQVTIPADEIQIDADYVNEILGGLITIQEGNTAWLLTIYTEDTGYQLIVELTPASAGHTCTYDQQVATADYLKTEATCESPAVYYRSCTCGEHATGDDAATFTSGDIGSHAVVGNNCKYCGALNVTNVNWYKGSKDPIITVSVQENAVADITVGCTPKASGVIGITSADPDTVSVSAGEVTTDTNGHATLQVTGVKTGEAKVTAYSKIDPSIKAELTVTVTCGHMGTETETTYTRVEGSENHAAVTVCSCGATVNTTTGSCVDEDADGLCDLCGGTVEVPEVTGPYEIYNSSVNGSWGTISLSSLSIEGVTVKGHTWNGTTCIITLAADTPADATVTFVPEGIGDRGAFYVSGNKSLRTFTLENGVGEVKVGTASSANYGAQKTEKTVKFQLEGTETVPVESITITPENPTMIAYGTLQLSATVYPENATVKDVVWSTSVDPMYIGVSSSGKVTAQSMGLGQYYTVTATSQSNPEVSASCRVFLDYKPETGISISAETMSLKVGETGKLTATVTVSDQLACNKTVTWTTSDADVATVDTNGNVTAIGTGTATITATSYSGYEAECEVTVEAGHTCVFDQQNTDARYLKSGATCKSAAVYYLSCACGEAADSDDATFTYGTVAPHNYNTDSGNCQWCGKANPLADITIDLGDGAGHRDLHGISLNLTSGENRILDLSFNAAEVLNLVTWTSTDESVAYVAYNNAQNYFELVPGNAGTVTISLYDNNDLVSATADDETQTPAPLASFTVSVEEEPIQVEGYSITMDADKPSQMVGEENITVSLKVGHHSLSYYNSYKLELSYDPSILSLTTATDEENHFNVDKDENGNVVITRYGSELDNETQPIVLTFEAVAPGVADVTLSKAYISESEAALESDAPEAKIIDNNQVVASGTTTITVGGYDVDLSEDFSSTQTALAPNEDLRFTTTISEFYDYTVIVEVESADGTWTALPADAIEGSGTENDPYVVYSSDITGNIRVRADKDGKFYDVTVTGGGAAALTPAEGFQFGTGKAQYMAEKGYQAVLSSEATGYTVTVQIGGVTYTGCTVENNVYTIPGADIKGNIEFIVEAPQPGPYNVTISGSGEGDVVQGTAADTVAHGQSYTFGLMLAKGYDYTVTATMGGTPVTPAKADETNADGSYTYTISGVTGTLAITIEKSNLVVEVSEYLDLNGSTMFLITATKTLGEGQTSLAYKGSTMFYSEQYGAWAYLVVVGKGETLTADTAKAYITVGNTEFNTIPVSLDVNKSNAVDINDAQLVYDMYAAKKYTDLTQPEIMEKLLRADTAQGNSAKLLDVQDARAVIAEVLK